MAKIKVNIEGKKYNYFKDVRLMDIANDYKNNFKYPILFAKVDNNFEELDGKLTENCVVEFFDCSSRIGARVYQKSITILLVAAFWELFKKDIEISFAIDKGICVNSTFDMTEEELTSVEAKMKELADKNLPISKFVVKKSEAIEYFKKRGNISKVESLSYNSNAYVTLYKLCDIYDYLYSVMPVSTGVFTNFKLKYLDERTFVLQTPVSYLDGDIPEYVHHEKMFEEFSNYKEW